MSVVKTTEEFSSRRKVRYGGGDSTPPSKYPLTSSSTNASLSPHKSFYGRDSDGAEAYFIEFCIGDFNFDEITIRTEGTTPYVHLTIKISMCFSNFYQSQSMSIQFETYVASS